MRANVPCTLAAYSYCSGLFLFLLDYYPSSLYTVSLRAWRLFCIAIFIRSIRLINGVKHSFTSPHLNKRQNKRNITGSILHSRTGKNNVVDDVKK